MTQTRLCSRQTCTREAIYTLTYAYSESTAVVGPLSQVREPHAYDLCDFHAKKLTAPQGWNIVRVGVGQAVAAVTDTVEVPVSTRVKGGYPPLRSVD